MDNKNLLLNNVTIKSEPGTSSPKKVLLTNASFSQITSKNVPNTRLASFKPPRDLLLTGSITNLNSSFNAYNKAKSTKRTFTPNINVTRKKSSVETSQNDLSSESNQRNKERDKNRKPPLNKKKAVNIIQTKGVFSEGLAPGKVKAFGSSSSERVYNERQIMDKPKLNLNKKINKNDEDVKLKNLLKDDVTDNPSLAPDFNFKPSCLPIVYNGKKQENTEELDKTFESLLVKTEKVSNINVNELKSESADVTEVFKGNNSPKLFLFEFPNFIQKSDSSEKKKSTKSQQTDADKDSTTMEGLSSLGEGFLGYLKIHESGRAYFAIGDTIIPLCLTRHGTRQEIMSTSIDKETSTGEVVSLGTVDASFTCSTNLFQDVS